MSRPLLLVVVMLAACRCDPPPEHGGDEPTTSGDEQSRRGGDPEADSKSSSESDPNEDDAKAGGDGEEGTQQDDDDPPRSQSDLPPPSSTRPSDAIRRASDPPALSASEEQPIDPPDEPPDNPFGYDRPVKGCLQGQIYLLDEGARGIPRRWKDLEEGPAAWACELNVEPKIWEQGLPGMGERYQWFAVRYEGAFRVTEPGTYGFRLRSDDGSRLLVDGELVVDNGGMHGTVSREGEIELEPGDHSVVVQYIQGAHHVALQLFVTPPDGEEGLLSVRWE